MEQPIINRVANSTLVTLDLEEMRPDGPRIFFDLGPLLYEGLVLKEKELRAYVQAHDWSQYTHCHVAIDCTADAIVPTWAFMLVSMSLQPYAKTIVNGDLKKLEEWLYGQVLARTDWGIYTGARVVVKGCSKVELPLSAYGEVWHRLRAVAASIMYGEPCSTVPLFKRPKSDAGKA